MGSFLHRGRPLMTVMIQTSSPAHARSVIYGASWEGADAFGLQLECLRPEDRSAETLASLYAAADGRPFYVTNYRGRFNEHAGDEELAEGLLRAADSGATLIDVIGDLYAPAEGQLTTDPAAVERQHRLIDALHEKGCEVLVSSHVMRYEPAERVLEIALAQKARGADIAKIVTAADTEDEELENLRTTALLRRELGIPFLFLSGGTHSRLHRQLGPMLGCCMWLAVYEHDESSTSAQPVLRTLRAMAQNFRNYPDLFS